MRNTGSLAKTSSSAQGHAYREATSSQFACTMNRSPMPRTGRYAKSDCFSRTSEALTKGKAMEMVVGSPEVS